MAPIVNGFRHGATFDLTELPCLWSIAVLVSPSMSVAL
jgi:hypothetical protein